MVLFKINVSTVDFKGNLYVPIQDFSCDKCFPFHSLSLGNTVNMYKLLQLGISFSMFFDVAVHAGTELTHSFGRLLPRHQP